MKDTADILLGVNIDHIATLRQQRGNRYPEPVQAALVAEQAGADAITVHLREDRRHIQERDIELLSQILQTRMNLEMAATDEMLSIAAAVKPEDCCLVPERREELTTEGGLDVCSNQSRLQEVCAVLRDSQIRVSLFVDPDKQQLDAAVAVGAPVVEIHTGRFADAPDASTRQREFERIRQVVAHGVDVGLQVNAGHGLDYHNVSAIAAIQAITELNIGFAIIARALFVGLGPAVAEMKRLMATQRLGLT